MKRKSIEKNNSNNNSNNNNNDNDDDKSNYINHSISRGRGRGKSNNNNNNNNNNNLEPIEKYRISQESLNEIKELFKQSTRLVIENFNIDKNENDTDLLSIKSSLNQLIKELVLFINNNKFKLDLVPKNLNDNNNNNNNNNGDITATTTTTTTTNDNNNTPILTTKEKQILDDKIKNIKIHIESLKNTIKDEKLKYKKDLKILNLLKDEPNSLEALEIKRNYQKNLKTININNNNDNDNINVDDDDDEIDLITTTTTTTTTTPISTTPKTNTMVSLAPIDKMPFLKTNL